MPLRSWTRLRPSARSSSGFRSAGILPRCWRHSTRSGWTSAILIAPAAPFGPTADGPRWSRTSSERHNTDEGWGKYNRHYWQQRLSRLRRVLLRRGFSELHSTKQIEDSVGWALDTTADTLTDTVLARVRAASGRGGALSDHPAPGPRSAWRPGSHRSPCEGPGGGRGNRRTAGHAGRVRPYSDRAPSRDHEPADPRFHRSHDRMRGVRRPWSSVDGLRPQQARALSLLADRTWARPTRSSDRRRAARACTRTSRSIGSRSIR